MVWASCVPILQGQRKPLYRWTQCDSTKSSDTVESRHTQTRHVSSLGLASYPGHVGGWKSGLVSTVCTCMNNSGNLPQTSPIMDKLHMVVIRRNNQTRYTTCSVAAMFTRRWLPLSDTQGVTRQGLRYNHRQFHCHCSCS